MLLSISEAVITPLGAAASEEAPLYFENYDLKDIVTPVRTHVLVRMLRQASYDPEEIKFLDQGFSQGFDIGYEGPDDRQSVSQNIPLRIGSETQLWNKLMKEVQAKRVAGPFDQIPYDQYIQSPIGLVPKGGANSGKTRLIFHLSYDFKQQQQLKSLNAFTPKEKCSVKYRDIDYAVKAYLKLNNLLRVLGDSTLGSPIFAGTADVQSAFRLVPLLRRCWKWLIMKARDPKSGGKWKYFVDECLPFGASISCAIFQRVSNALKHLIEFRTDAIPDTVTNYLDDFLFLAFTILACNALIREFLTMCEQIGIPISEEKTSWVSELVVFLGLLLDGRELVLRIPLEKRAKAIYLLESLVVKKKATVHQLQELCGYFNFLCRAIYVGRTFVRRMYVKYSSVVKVPGLDKPEKFEQAEANFHLKPYHHVRLDQEFKADCRIWLSFLQDSDISKMINRPMVDVLPPEVTSTEICFYSDASAALDLGYGCILNTKWIQGFWDKQFMTTNKPSIEFLELFALCAGIFTWQNERALNNCRIMVFCDNQGVIGMVNNMTSSCRHCMLLIRMLVLNNLKCNRRLRATYVASKENELADALSRGQMTRFRRKGPHMDEYTHRIHEDLWPMEKIWMP